MVASVSNVFAVSAIPSLSWSDVGLRLLSVLLLIAINAFFVTAEFSIVSVRRSRIHQLVEDGDAQAISVQALQKSIDRLLSTTQLGITLSSLALGWIGENTMAVLVSSWIRQWFLPHPMHSLMAHSLSIPVAFLSIAYLQIVLGELCPKSVALRYSEELARFLGPSVRAIARLFNPFIWILNQSTRWLLRMVGIQHADQGWRSPVTSKELQLIIATERESTGLEAEERQLLNNVFEFGDVTAATVMVKRTNIVALPISATFQALLPEMTATGYSRYPVVGKSLDDIRGIIHFKELATPLTAGNLDFELQPWIRPALFVPEHTPLSELLPLMQRSQLAMVIVVNEFGGTVGLVTIQDLIAEIIGNVGADTGELMIYLDEQTFLVQAQLNLADVNQLLELNLPIKNEYQTLGGFLLYQLQKIPALGETLHYQDIELTVVATVGPRLHQIKLHKLKTLIS